MIPTLTVRGLACALAATALLAGALFAQGPRADAFSFVVLGHVRGGKDGPNPKLAELLNDARRLRPSFAVLTGDMIWGDVDRNPADTVGVLREWFHLDSAMATLGVPTYRVPGNHDINDLRTRDIYHRRYGTLPRAVAVGDGTSRLLLLSSTWTPTEGDTGKMRFVRGVDLDTAQVTWLRSELAKPGFAHTFVFLHHLLWWEPDTARWWREVHPLLAAARVDAVFSGDYGPLKFSTMSRDGVDYFQCAIEGSPSIGNLRNINNRILSSQFDNYLEVRVGGPTVDVAVHTVAEVSSGFFTPDHHRRVNEAAAVRPPAPPAEPAWRRAWAMVGSPKRLLLLVVGALGLMSCGWWARGRVAARGAIPR